MKNKPKPFLKPAMDKTMRKMLRGYAKVIKDLPGCVMIPVYLDKKLIDATRKCTPLCDLIPKVGQKDFSKSKETLLDKIKRIVRKLL